MLNNLVKLYDAGEFFIDERGISFDKTAPLKTVTIEFYGKPYCQETPVKRSCLNELEVELMSLSPIPNAWLDKGIIKKGSVKVKIPDIDPDGNIYAEKKPVVLHIRKIEFYHIGK